MEDYLSLNKQEWNKRTLLHVDSDFYNLKGFKAGKSSLNEIELALLGDVKDLSICHLQCHFGMDSLSLSRMGAKVVGLDLSDEAIKKATELNDELGLSARFVCGDVYSAPELISERFDMVFTSYGTIGWLPDLGRWASVVSNLLKPGGRLVFVEFHPFIWVYDDSLQEIRYTYFNKESIHESEEGSYASETKEQLRSISWNHALSEVVSALQEQGLKLDDFKEYDYSPYPIFPEQKEFESGKFRPSIWGDKLPLVYSLCMSK